MQGISIIKADILSAFLLILLLFPLAALHRLTRLADEEIIPGMRN